MQNLSAYKSTGTPVNIRGKPYHLLIGNRKNMQFTGFQIDSQGIHVCTSSLKKKWFRKLV